VDRSQPWQILRETLSRKKPSKERAGGVVQGVGPEFKPQYHKKKKIAAYFLLPSRYSLVSVPH
jgi:hypothetical protein